MHIATILVYKTA